MEEKIQKVGKINYISKLTDGDGTRISNEFFKKLIKEFAKQTSLYIRATEEVPFAFSERQLNSVIAPAISKISPAFLMEAPVDRKWSSISKTKYNDSYGRVDYWCYYRNIVFLIEIKHDFISCKTGSLRKILKEDWNTALEQLDVIENEAKFRSEDCKGVFRVALDIVPLYETVNHQETKTLGKEEQLLNIQNKAMNGFDRNPNWSAMWMLHKDLVGPYEYTNAKECYPGILFLCNIYEVIKQN